jgi:hypothetical protein
MALMITTSCPHCGVNLLLVRNEKYHKRWDIKYSGEPIKLGGKPPTIAQALQAQEEVAVASNIVQLESTEELTDEVL